MFPAAQTTLDFVEYQSGMMAIRNDTALCRNSANIHGYHLRRRWVEHNRASIVITAARKASASLRGTNFTSSSSGSKPLRICPAQ